MNKTHGMRTGWALMALIMILSLAACSTAQAPSPGASFPPLDTPPLPERIQAYEQGVPVIQVYVTEDKQIQAMSLEEYLYGVLAGEMKNDWPMEALKAQAILARTFVLRFMTEKESRHEGADISTDIEEAQAYDAASINERIRQAVDETRGMVLVSGQEFPYAWFHAHSGGTTSLAKEGLGYEKEEPGYTQVTEGQESEQAPEDAKAWETTFTQAQFLSAARALGVNATRVENLEIGERGPSGRAQTLLLNGQPLPAPSLRIELGSTDMRSTFLEDIRVEGGNVTLSGKGYGHGVGMSQWGAYGMAEAGSDAEAIVTHYFRDVAVKKMW